MKSAAKHERTCHFNLVKVRPDKYSYEEELQFVINNGSQITESTRRIPFLAAAENHTFIAKIIEGNCGDNMLVTVAFSVKQPPSAKEVLCKCDVSKLLFKYWIVNGEHKLRLAIWRTNAALNEGERIVGRFLRVNIIEGTYSSKCDALSSFELYE